MFSDGLIIEKQFFQKLQEQFAIDYKLSFSDPLAPKTLVVIPSLTMDQEILSKIQGSFYYEERLLCLLMLLKMPRTHIIYVTSVPIDPVIIDYYLHLLPCITGYHARHRLTLLSCLDSSVCSLTEKVLARPRLIERIRQAVAQNSTAHLAFFNVTELERTLAIKLQLPLYGCDPDLNILGNKSNSRKLFKDCGIKMPLGYEDIYSFSDVVKSLSELKKAQPSLKKAIIKLNDGFSGDGNAIFYYNELLVNQKLENHIKEQISQRVKIVAQGLSLEKFLEKLSNMGGIVEAFVSGDAVRSPSVQCRINPLGECDVISTHDQVLGGESNQVFIGATFPASTDYAVDISKMGKALAEQLKNKGVLGRFSADFVSVKNDNKWCNYAIEINLRKGGTTHPYLMLQFLTNGKYNYKKAAYYTNNKQKLYYFCSDNLQNDSLKGLTPHDLIDIAMCNNLFYNSTLQQGVMFHLMGALSQYGKLGLVCIGDSLEKAQSYYEKTVSVLLRECRNHIF